jgi:hypothetical protein
MTYEVVIDSVSGGALVVEVDTVGGTKYVIARCPNSTRANQVADALNA